MTKEEKETLESEKRFALKEIKKGGIYTFGGLLSWSIIVYIGFSCHIESHLFKIFGRLVA